MSLARFTQDELVAIARGTWGEHRTLAEDLLHTRAALAERDAEVARLRELFQETRRRMCRSFGVEEGKSWSWLESEVSQWRKSYLDLADAVCRESSSPEDACRQARATRAEVAGLREALDGAQTLIRSAAPLSWAAGTSLEQDAYEWEKRSDVVLDAIDRALASTTPSALVADKTSETGSSNACELGQPESTGGASCSNAPSPSVGNCDQGDRQPFSHRAEAPQEPGVTPSAPVAVGSASDDAPFSKSASLETAANVTREPGATEEGPGASPKALACAWASGPCRAGRQRIEDAGCVDDLADLIRHERTQSRAAVVAEIVAWLRRKGFYGASPREIADAIERGEWQR